MTHTRIVDREKLRHVNISSWALDEFGNHVWKVIDLLRQFNDAYAYVDGEK